MQPPPDMAPLLAYGAVFADPDFTFGAWSGGGTEAGVMQSPYYAFSEGGLGFIEAVVSGNWVRPEIDWSSDGLRQSYQHMITTPMAIETASQDDMAHLLTTLVRGDRFNEGMLAQAFNDGTLARIVARAVALAERG